MLNFVDDTQVRVRGLDEIMADLRAGGKQANDETAEEIIAGLEAHKNYIPSSGRARKEYAYVLLKEYKRFLKDHSNTDQ